MRPRYCERKLTPFFGKTGLRNILLVKHFQICFSVFIRWPQWTNFSVSCFSLIVQSSTEVMQGATRYEWDISPYHSCFPIKPNNLDRSVVAHVYPDISLRYLFWRLKPLYRPVLEWQLLKLNSCSLFNRESVWSLIWTCWSQDASVPITPLRTKEMVGQNCPFVISGKHMATLSLPNDFNCQH